MVWVERRKANKEQKELLRDQKKDRLDRAAMSTLSERTRAWSLREDDGHQSPKRKRDTDWLPTPTKRQRKNLERMGTNTNRSLLCPAMREGAIPLPGSVGQGQARSISTSTNNIAKSPVQAKILLFEISKDVGGPQKAYRSSKEPTVRTKKWVKKKNGLFGWVSCVQTMAEIKDPQGGGGSEKK